MKKTVLAIGLILMSFSKASYAKTYEASGFSRLPGVTDTLKQYCSQSYTTHSSECLAAYLTYRCTVNFMFTDPFYIDDCVAASASLVTLLDITQPKFDAASDGSPDPFLKLHQIAFSHRLVKAFLTPSAPFAEKMNQYQSDLEESYRFSKPHSLWNRTLLNSGNNREKALETMVTLFQDVSSKDHFQFVDDVSSHMKKGNRDVVIANLTALNGFYDQLTANNIDKAANPNYRIYPAVRESVHLNSMVHHYYTPAYLALLLKKAGYEEGVAFYVSLLFNTTYEFIKLDRKMGTHRWPLQDPLPFDAKTYSLQAQKIYTGYAGAMFGIGREASVMKYETFVKQLSDDPSGFITSLAY